MEQVHGRRRNERKKKREAPWKKKKNNQLHCFMTRCRPNAVIEKSSSERKHQNRASPESDGEKSVRYETMDIKNEMWSDYIPFLFALSLNIESDELPEGEQCWAALSRLFLFRQLQRALSGRVCRWEQFALRKTICIRIRSIMGGRVLKLSADPRRKRRSEQKRNKANERATHIWMNAVFIFAHAENVRMNRGWKMARGMLKPMNWNLIQWDVRWKSFSARLALRLSAVAVECNVIIV